MAPRGLSRGRDRRTDAEHRKRERAAAFLLLPGSQHAQHSTAQPGRPTAGRGGVPGGEGEARSCERRLQHLIGVTKMWAQSELWAETGVQGQRPLPRLCMFMWLLPCFFACSLVRLYLLYGGMRVGMCLPVRLCVCVCVYVPVLVCSVLAPPGTPSYFWAPKQTYIHGGHCWSRPFCFVSVAVGCCVPST